MINAQNIRKSFGSLNVLNGVSFSVAQSTVTALIGPSGGGKSTLLRCVNTLEVPESGTLSLGDIRVDFDEKGRARHDELLRFRRRTGMIFQNFQLFPHRTVIQNVMEGLVTVAGWKQAKAEKRAYELLERVGITQKANSYLATLSGGQQQRVAIARALALSPDVLLCDEPTSALDPELAAEVVDVLKGLARDGMTMLIATHDLRFAGSVAREILFLDGGVIVESGAPESLLGKPVQTRTKAFIAAASGLSPDSYTI